MTLLSIIPRHSGVIALKNHDSCIGLTIASYSVASCAQKGESMKISANVFEKSGVQVCENRPAADSSGVFGQMVASVIIPSERTTKPVVPQEQPTDPLSANLPAAVQAIALAGASAKALIESERMTIEHTALELEKSLSIADRNEPTKLLGNDTVSIVAGGRSKTEDPWDRYRTASSANNREAGGPSSGRGFYVGIRIAIG